MDRLLSFILIGLIALGNSFSHKHDDCHADHGAGGTHVHLSIACSHATMTSGSREHKHGHSHDAAQSHSHADSHDQTDERISEIDSNEAERTSESRVSGGHGLGECYCGACCSSGGQLIWIPTESRFIAGIRDAVAKFFGCQYPLRPICVSEFRRFSCLEGVRFRLCHTSPIYLRHSVLLI